MSSNDDGTMRTAGRLVSVLLGVMISGVVMKLGSLYSIAPAQPAANDDTTFHVVVPGPHDHGIFALVGRDDEVQIDWKAVDQWVADKDADPRTRSIALALKATRDGSWSPINGK